jgi:hypothetical protein
MSAIFSSSRGNSLTGQQTENGTRCRAYEAHVWRADICRVCGQGYALHTSASSPEMSQEPPKITSLSGGLRTRAATSVPFRVSFTKASSAKDPPAQISSGQQRQASQRQSPSSPKSPLATGSLSASMPSLAQHSSQKGALPLPDEPLADLSPEQDVNNAESGNGEKAERKKKSLSAVSVSALRVGSTVARPIFSSSRAANVIHRPKNSSAETPPSKNADNKPSPKTVSADHRKTLRELVENSPTGYHSDSALPPVTPDLVTSPPTSPTESPAGSEIRRKPLPPKRPPRLGLEKQSSTANGKSVSLLKDVHKPHQSHRGPKSTKTPMDSKEARKAFRRRSRSFGDLSQAFSNVDFALQKGNESFRKKSKKSKKDKDKEKEKEKGKEKEKEKGKGKPKEKEKEKTKKESSGWTLLKMPGSSRRSKLRRKSRSFVNLTSIFANVPPSGSKDDSVLDERVTPDAVSMPELYESSSSEPAVDDYGSSIGAETADHPNIELEDSGDELPLPQNVELLQQEMRRLLKINKQLERALIISNEKIKKLNQDNDHFMGESIGVRTQLQRIQKCLDTQRKENELLRKTVEQLEKYRIQKEEEEKLFMLDSVKLLESLGTASPPLAPSPPALPSSSKVSTSESSPSPSPSSPDDRPFNELLAKAAKRISRADWRKSQLPVPGSRLLQEREKRDLVVKEILTTERYYMKCLSVLINEFQKPLSAAVEIESRAWKVTREHIKCIFYHIEGIYQCTTLLLKQLEERTNSWSATSVIGDIFVNMADYMKIYRSFVNNYAKAHQALKECHRDPTFVEYVKSVYERNAKLGTFKGYTIDTFLITPVQRVPRYLSLLQSLLRYTPKDHADYPLIEQAIKKISVVADENEKSHEASINVNKLCQIQRLMSSKTPSIQIVEPHRRFLREGYVYISQLGGERRLIRGQKQRFIILFNDILLFSKPLRSKSKELETKPKEEEDELEYLFHFDVKNCRVLDDDDLGGDEDDDETDLTPAKRRSGEEERQGQAQGQGQHSILLFYRDGSMRFYTESAEAKKDWWTSLTAAIADTVGKTRKRKNRKPTQG